MKIIFDTNVILSALTTQGLSYRVFEICIDNHTVFISHWIVKEVSQNLKDKFKVIGEEIERVTDFLNRSFVLCAPKGVVPGICRDKDDNHILLLADFINADLIISGDKGLLDIKEYKNTRIINPRIFIEKYKEK